MAPKALGAGSSPPDGYRERSGKGCISAAFFCFSPTAGRVAMFREEGWLRKQLGWSFIGQKIFENYILAAERKQEISPLLPERSEGKEGCPDCVGTGWSLYAPYRFLAQQRL